MENENLVVVEPMIRWQHLTGLLAFAILFASGSSIAFAQGNLMQPRGGSFNQPPNNPYQNANQPNQGWQPQPFNNGPNGVPNGMPNGNVPLVASNSNNAIPTGTGNAAQATITSDTKIPTRNLLQIFHDGGIMMYPIVFCSFVLMVFSFERFIYLRSGRVIPRPFVKRLIEQLQQQQIERDEAIDLCERNPSPIATVFASALKRYGKSAVEVEQAALDAGERESNQLRRYLRLFNAVSNVSPLLGLLGTVLGMIQSFNDIATAQAMGKPEMLAGGISQALFTTAAGLLVAIPAYLLYIYFVGHTDKLIMEIDKQSMRLVDAISAEGLQENDTSRSRSRSRKAA